MVVSVMFCLVSRPSEWATSLYASALELTCDDTMCTVDVHGGMWVNTSCSVAFLCAVCTDGE